MNPYESGAVVDMNAGHKTPAAIVADAFPADVPGLLAEAAKLVGQYANFMESDGRPRTAQEARELATALASAAQPAVPRAQMTEEIDNVLSDPDTRLSPGAERALRWLRTWTAAPLALAAAPKAAPAPAPASQGDAEDAARYRWLRSIRPRAGHGDITVSVDDRKGLEGFRNHRELWGAELDAAIDAASAQAKGGGADAR